MLYKRNGSVVTKKSSVISPGNGFREIGAKSGRSVVSAYRKSLFRYRHVISSPPYRVLGMLPSTQALDPTKRRRETVANRHRAVCDAIQQNRDIVFVEASAVACSNLLH